MNITNTINDIKSRFDSISDDRKHELDKMVQFLKVREKQETDLIFICVHNSRRSHLSQVWAQVAAHHYGFSQVNCYSGGTEVTAMYPMIASTLQSQGLIVQNLSAGENPVYSIKYHANAHPIICFSKMFDDRFNPQNDFGAIMVCSSADDNCPFISTAAKRILLSFEDPKSSDGTAEQEDVYADRSLQIASEFFYVFSKV
jgi:arsenate reductase